MQKGVVNIQKRFSSLRIESRLTKRRRDTANRLRPLTLSPSALIKPDAEQLGAPIQPNPTPTPPGKRATSLPNYRLNWQAGYYRPWQQKNEGMFKKKHEKAKKCLHLNQLCLFS